MSKEKDYEKILKIIDEAKQAESVDLQFYCQFLESLEKLGLGKISMNNKTMLKIQFFAGLAQKFIKELSAKSKTK